MCGRTRGMAQVPTLAHNRRSWTSVYATARDNDLHLRRLRRRKDMARRRTLIVNSDLFRAERAFYTNTTSVHIYFIRVSYTRTETNARHERILLLPVIYGVLDPVRAHNIPTRTYAKRPMRFEPHTKKKKITSSHFFSFFFFFIRSWSMAGPGIAINLLLFYFFIRSPPPRSAKRRERSEKRARDSAPGHDNARRPFSGGETIILLWVFCHFFFLLFFSFISSFPILLAPPPPAISTRVLL